MNVLLDTHVWLWYHLGAKQLEDEHKKVIENKNVAIWLSPISVWETHLLIERGRLPVKASPAAWIKLALSALQTGEARLSNSIAIRSRLLNLHDDPADRFIAATAIELNYKLATSDRRLRGYSELNCI